MFDLFVRIDVKPALAAFFLRPGVPGDRQRLNTAVGEFDEVLLQRVDAESVFHLEHGKLAVRPVRFDQKFAVLAEEARMHAVMIEACVVEITEHGLVGCVLHRSLVLRGTPQFGFRLVAASTGLAADETCRRRNPAVTAQVEANASGDDDQHHGHRCNPDRPPRQAGGAGFGRSSLSRRLTLRRFSVRPLPRTICMAGFASLACQRPSPSVPGSRRGDRAILHQDPAIIGRPPIKSSGRPRTTEQAHQFGQREYFMLSSSPIPGKIRTMVLSSITLALN